MGAGPRNLDDVLGDLGRTLSPHPAIEECAIRAHHVDQFSGCRFVVAGIP